MTPGTGGYQPDRNPDETYLRVAEEDDARLQPDPELALSRGRASRAQIWVVSLIALAVIALVMYGLTQDGARQSAQSPSTTTGAAPSETAPARQPQTSPSETPAREPAKPGPAESAR